MLSHTLFFSPKELNNQGHRVLRHENNSEQLKGQLNYDLLSTLF